MLGFQLGIRKCWIFSCVKDESHDSTVKLCGNVWVCVWGCARVRNVCLRVRVRYVCARAWVGVRERVRARVCGGQPT